MAGHLSSATYRRLMLAVLVKSVLYSAALAAVRTLFISPRGFVCVCVCGLGGGRERGGRGAEGRVCVCVCIWFGGEGCRGAGSNHSSKTSKIVCPAEDAHLQTDGVWGIMLIHPHP